MPRNFDPIGGSIDDIVRALLFEINSEIIARSSIVVIHENLNGMIDAVEGPRSGIPPLIAIEASLNRHQRLTRNRVKSNVAEHISSIGDTLLVGLHQEPTVVASIPIFKNSHVSGPLIVLVHMLQKLKIKI